MTDSILIDAVGAVVRIDLAGLDADGAHAVRAAWRDALAPAGSDATATVRPEPRPTRAAMLMRLSQQVTLAALDARRGELWMLHAAGLALPDGRVVVLIGPSGRGKTTAARVLGQTYGYVSDESIGIAPDGSILPYRKPLSIIERRGEPKAERAPSEVGLKALPDAPLRLAAIVLLDRRADGPIEPLVQMLDVGDALEDLVLQSSCLPEMSTPLRGVAKHAAATGGVVRVTYRESDALPAVVESLTARAPLASAPDADEPALAPPGAGDDDEPSYERAPSIDAIVLADPDRVAVLNRSWDGTGTVRVLAGVAPAIWRRASRASLEELVAAAVEAYGPPDEVDARQIVASAVAELVEAGVLIRRDPVARPA